MPLYTYKCMECGKTQDAFNSISNRFNGPECCGKPTEHQIVPTQIAPIIGGGNLPGYKCPVTGEFVTSRKRRKEIMQKHNLVEKG